MNQFISWSVFGSVLTPFFALSALTAACVFRVPLHENHIRRAAKLSVVLSSLLIFAVTVIIFARPELCGIYKVLEWYSYADHSVYFEFIVDRLSMAFSCLAIFLALVVGYFSSRYLYRDPGYLRYFCMYLTFVTGLLLVFLSAESTLLVIGWELVGLSSVLLISFFRERSTPVASAVWTFNTYRLGDLCMLIGMILIGHNYSDVLHGDVHKVSVHASPAVIMSLLLVAAMIKSAQLPFSSWLPRAMEGPTPSSAIFYGALSTHLGVYLLLRTGVLWMPLTGFRFCLFAIGLSSTIYGAFVGRTRADIKTQLGYAVLAQVGLMFMEISLGWFTLATMHAILHSSLRTMQFLRAPAAYRDFFELKPFLSLRSDVEKRYLTRLRVWLYSQSLFRIHLDELVILLVVNPLLKLSFFFRSCDDFFSYLLMPKSEALLSPPLSLRSARSKLGFFSAKRRTIKTGEPEILRANASDKSQSG